MLSWSGSPDPDFAAEAADIVGLYLDPPRDTNVLALDEKPHIQALERAPDHLWLADGRRADRPRPHLQAPRHDGAVRRLGGGHRPEQDRSRQAPPAVSRSSTS